MKYFLILLSMSVLVSCAASPPVLKVAEDGSFRIDVFEYHSNHEEVIAQKLQEKGICSKGYELTSNENFYFGCTLGDCKGVSYFGECK